MQNQESAGWIRRTLATQEEVPLKLIWLLLLPAPVAVFAQAAMPPPNSSYVGSAVCKGCHPDVWMNFPKNPHFRSVASGKETPENTGCEGCHGPGAAHVKAGGGKTTIPHAFSLMEPAQILDDCLRCHVKDISRANIRRSVHTDADVVCSTCHSIHKSPTPKFLLAKAQKDLCYQCHGTVRAQFDMPVKHRVNEGVIQCSDCHNPHGTFAATWRMGVRPAMVDQSAGSEEACIKCHQDKRGPFVFEHAVIRVDGCESCHSPHGSMNSKLLRRPVVFTLCLECHNGAGSFGRLGSGVLAQSSAHNMLDPRFQNCTMCHVRIHGSNADQFFLR
jgi:DmsE family decaheme c-type cytochrome